MTVVECLERARDRITAGWCQHRLHRDGKYCIVGALTEPDDGCSYACCETDDGKTVLDYLYEVLGAGPLTHWNDDPARTQKEVIDALTRAIELAKGNSNA